MNEERTADSISEITRRAVIDYLTASGISWSGRMQEDSFLARFYNLSFIESTDDRFDSAKGDIWKHRVINSDWPDDWVFYGYSCPARIPSFQLACLPLCLSERRC